MSTIKSNPEIKFLLQLFYQAFGNADKAALSSIVSENIIWHHPGRGPLSRDWKGINEIVDGLATLADKLGQGHVGFELLHVFGNDECEVSIHRDYYTGTDNQFNLLHTLFVKISNNKIQEIWEAPFDQYESDRFWSTQARTLLIA